MLKHGCWISSYEEEFCQSFDVFSLVFFIN